MSCCEIKLHFQDEDNYALGFGEVIEEVIGVEDVLVNGESVVEDKVAYIKTAFIFEQNVASDTWVIEHDLNKFPSVTIVDSAESQVVGDVEYIDKTKLVVTFNGAFSGKAYLN